MQDLPNHCGIPVERSPMQWGSTVLATRIDRPARGKHEPDRLCVVGLRGVGDFAAVAFREFLSQMGASGEQRIEGGFVAEFARKSQLELGGAVLHEQAEDVLMTKFASDGVRRLVHSERPDVDASTCPWVLHGEVFFGDTRA